MRAEQKMLNTVTLEIAEHCSTLEETAELIRSYHISPDVKTTTAINPKIRRLNFTALSCFLIGVAALGCFVGYNLWNT